jgi:hypothetical protein
MAFTGAGPHGTMENDIVYVDDVHHAHRQKWADPRHQALTDKQQLVFMHCMTSCAAQRSPEASAAELRMPLPLYQEAMAALAASGLLCRDRRDRILCPFCLRRAHNHPLDLEEA